MAAGDAHVFPGFLTPVLAQLFFPKPPTTFLTCFSRGERRKYAGKKVRLNLVSNSQPSCHESDTLNTEQSGGQAKVNNRPSENIIGKGENAGNQHFLLSPKCFLPSKRPFSSFFN